MLRVFSPRHHFDVQDWRDPWHAPAPLAGPPLPKRAGLALGAAAIAANVLVYAGLDDADPVLQATRDIPAGIETARDLIDWLKSQGEEYAHAFEKPDTIRIAIDQTHADHDATITGAREVAFFPPVTGG